MSSHDDRLVNLVLSFADIEWARRAVRTIIDEKWESPWLDRAADMFEAFSFEYRMNEAKSKGMAEVAATYWDMYLSLRVERNVALLRAVVELW